MKSILWQARGEVCECWHGATWNTRRKFGHGWSKAMIMGVTLGYAFSQARMFCSKKYAE